MSGATPQFVPMGSEPKRAPPRETRTLAGNREAVMIKWIGVTVLLSILVSTVALSQPAFADDDDCDDRSSLFLAYADGGDDDDEDCPEPTRDPGPTDTPKPTDRPTEIPTSNPDPTSTAIPTQEPTDEPPVVPTRITTFSACEVVDAPPAETPAPCSVCCCGSVLASGEYSSFDPEQGYFILGASIILGASYIIGSLLRRKK